jgi:hypothetical protein
LRLASLQDKKEGLETIGRWKHDKQEFLGVISAVTTRTMEGTSTLHNYTWHRKREPFKPNQVSLLTFAHHHKKIPTTQISRNIKTMTVTFYSFCVQ